jgi:plastocyanin
MRTCTDTKLKQREPVTAAFRRAAFALVFAIFFALLATATIYAAPGDKQASKEARIEIKDFSFQPKEVTVPIGAKVVWVNKDEEPHTIVSTDKTFVSKALDTDDTFSFTFDKTGTYEYFCSVHPRMTAKIVVIAHDKQPMKMDKMN